MLIVVLFMMSYVLLVGVRADVVSVTVILSIQLCGVVQGALMWVMLVVVVVFVVCGRWWMLITVLF